MSIFWGRLLLLAHLVYANFITEERGGIMHGKVKWFNNEKGYGFIEYENLEDIFVHYSAIVKDGYKTLNEGALVNFKLVETAKGLQAIDVVEEQKTIA
jgi:CspA family cold shock protein